MNISPNDVSIQLTHHVDGRGEYGAFYLIYAHIYVAGCEEKAGHISAVLVNRRRIPQGMFLSAMDGHSSILQDLASIFFDPQLGRVKVRSLKVDDDRAAIMCIEEMHVDNRYKIDGNSDVGAFALNQLLHHPYVNSWNFGIVLYILDYRERSEPDIIQRLRDDNQLSNSERLDLLTPYKRLDANHFLRNGFYQDRTVSSIGNSCVVAVKSNWDAPLKSHDEVASVQFYEPPPCRDPPTGTDKELFDLTKSTCTEARRMGTDYDPRVRRRLNETRETFNSMKERVQQMLNEHQQLLGDMYQNELFEDIEQQFREIEDLESRMNPAVRLNNYRQQVERLIQDGGDLSRSNALHAAAANMNGQIVTCILALDRSTLEARDSGDLTPLMVAADIVASQGNPMRGFPDHAVIDILVASGANKDATNREGMTAYGIFVRTFRKNAAQLYAAMGQRIPRLLNAPGYSVIIEKLMPMGGPTIADIQGFSEEVALIHYAS